MKKYLLKCPAILLYLFAIACFSIYIWAELNPRLYMAPAGRLVLLCSSCAAIYLGSLLLAKTTDKVHSRIIMKSSFWLFFVLYVILISTFTLFDSYFGRNRVTIRCAFNDEMLQLYIKNSINVIPFATISKYLTNFFAGTINKRIVVTNILGNIIAFAPFALFLPLLFKKINSFKRFLIAMLCIVTTVELLQLAMLVGSCDIDDIILNVGGACMFYGIFHISPIRKSIEKVTALSY